MKEKFSRDGKTLGSFSQLVRKVMSPDADSTPYLCGMFVSIFHSRATFNTYSILYSLRRGLYYWYSKFFKDDLYFMPKMDCNWLIRWDYIWLKCC